MKEIRHVQSLRPDELATEAKNLQAPLDLVEMVHKTGRLPVPNFSAGGIATPADAALMMSLGAETVFVGSGIFKSSDPARHAKAIVKAATYWNDPMKVLEACEDVGEPMRGQSVATMPENELMAGRGW